MACALIGGLSAKKAFVLGTCFACFAICWPTQMVKEAGTKI